MITLKSARNWFFVQFFFQSASLVFGQQSFHVMTFNIRLDMASDSLNAWTHRKEKVVSQIRFHEFDLLGVQEAQPNQMRFLEKSLSEFQSVGVGRDDGKDNGEYSAIFVRKSRFEILASSTFWLSETPNQPGKKGWDAACNRIVTWAKLKDRKTGKVLFHFNTHLDHMGQVARRESARLILKAVDSLAGKIPALVTGDFNAFPQDEPIRILTDSTDLRHLIDSRSASKMPHYGPEGTFNGFGPKEQADEPIDYIFFNWGFQILKHATLSQTWHGRFSSDHFPVWVKVLQVK